MKKTLGKRITAALSALICFLSTSTGLWTDQLDSMQSIQKVADGFYTMNYTYDYDIDEMIERGVPNHVDLVLHGAINTMAGRFDNLLHGKGFGCTTFNGINGQGEYLLARNFDYMDSPSMLVWTHPKNGYASVSTVSLYFMAYTEKFLPEDEARSLLTLLAPYAPVDGMNEKGLSIAVLELETSPVFQRTKNPNLTTSTMVRAVLDKAATVDEAVAIFKSHDMRDLLVGECTYHYQIADAKGKTVVIEYVDGETKVLTPEKNSKNGVNFMAAANFYLSEGVKDPHGLGRDRYDLVMKSLKKSKGWISEKDAMKLLQKTSMKDADMNGYTCSTLWSEVYNTHDKTVDVCVNNNYKTVYHYAVSQPQKLLK